MGGCASKNHEVAPLHWHDAGIDTAWTFVGEDPACASYDGINCLWGMELSDIDQMSLRPLVCGTMHAEKWGITGYEKADHWCFRLRQKSR